MHYGKKHKKKKKKSAKMKAMAKRVGKGGFQPNAGKGGGGY
tara:strand:+ start:2254 stop:2376 length:123 start_codon:yes stop_codon:yes gene_type:complete